MIFGKQFLAGLISSFTAFCFGCGVAWPSSGLCLQHYNCYQFQATREQWEWTHSLLSLGAACWCLPMGVLMKYHGSKTLMVVQLIPYMGASILLIFGNNIYMLYASRYLLGMCGAAICVAVPVYLVEISQMEQRGVMGSMFFGGIIYGIICTHMLRKAFGVSIVTISYIHLVQALFCVFLKYIPESPIFYAYRGKLGMAYSSLRWLRSKDYDLNSELKDIMLTSRNSKMEEMRGFWRQMRGVSRGVVLLLLFQLNGFVVISGYLHNILSDRTKKEHNIDIIYLLVCLGAGQLACFLLIDLIGRRTLLIISSVGIMFPSFYLTLWFRIWDNMNWTWSPLVAFCAFTFSFAIGFGPVTWVVTVELIYDPSRPYGCACAATFSWLSSFLMTRWWGFAFNNSKVFYFLIVTSMIGFLFVIVFIPETKRLSTAEIQKKLSVPKSPNESFDSF